MNRFLVLFGMFAVFSGMSAQRIDINFSNANVNQTTAPGYTPWTFGRTTIASSKFETKEAGDSIVLTLSAAQGAGLFGGAIHTNWWKDGAKTKGTQLVGDMAININLLSDGNYQNITQESSGLELKVEGLKKGTHTLLAYHSNTDNNGDAIAPLNIYVNGVVVATGVKQRCRGVTPSTTPYSYISFEVTDELTPTIIRYISQPEAGVTYANTAVALNALVFDENDPFTMSHDPYPAHQDFHVDGDAGTILLQWSPSLLSAKHHVMVGLSSGEEVEVSCQKDTSYLLQDVYSMNTYYWRVDEEDASGNIYKGEEWEFRPRQLAFPGAEGYGRYAIGGRGGMVYHVTNLKHDHEPGSLLYGLTDLEGPRTIVFDVSGLIEMDMGSIFVDKYVTIAGQTAPGKGICLKYSNVNICSDDICRFMRFKRGYGDTGNALGMSGADHAIVDHSTAAWGTDETVSGRGAQNISFQYNMIAEALGIADHKNYGSGTNHGYAATIDGRVGSWHHNLLANCYGRNWSMGGGMDATNTAIGQMDIFNNVVYNWGKRTTDGGCHEVNFVNNYYKMGESTSLKTLFTQQYENVGSEQSKWQAYISGNIRENKDHTLSQDKLGDTYKYSLSNGAVDPNTRNDEYQYNTFVNAPFFPSYAEIHSAKDAFKIVNSYAGAYMPCPDDHHNRIVKETVTGTYTYTGSRSNLKGQIDHEDDCRGFEEYPEIHRESDYDTDQDGIPDWYEQIVGTDPKIANNNADPDRDGWTQLEDYLEFMSHPYSVLSVGETANVNLAPFFAGFTNAPTYSVVVPTEAGVSASISGSILAIQAGSQSSVLTLQIKVVDKEGSSFVRKYNVAISEKTSGVETLKNEPFLTGEEYYDLLGRRINSTHGIKVRQGRLILNGER